MQIEWLWESRCVGCDLTGEGQVCPRCRPARVHRVGTHLVGIRGVIVTAPFPSAVGKTVKVAKYGAHRALAVQIAMDWASAMEVAVRHSPIDAIVPVPPIRSRLVQRGFSLPALMAHALARKTGLPLIDGALSIAEGPQQAGLDLRARRASLEGRVRLVREVKGAVLLVDDVITSGATAEACGRELLGGSATVVYVAAICATRPRVTRVPDS